MCYVPLACLAATLTAAGVVVYTAWGRDQVRQQVNRRVSAFIAGSLEIEHIDEIALPHVKTRGVTLADPSGRPAIEAKSVDIELDLEAIWNGRFAWHRADIRGGRVHVREDDQGRINMEETFRAAHPTPDSNAEHDTQGKGPLDLRGMATSNIELLIDGGTLPTLRMTSLTGIMRVHVLANDDVELPFSKYEGHFVEGLPTGRLDFHHVNGRVQTSGKRLLRFEGQGKSEGEQVSFVLDIHTQPKTNVEIDARFPKLSAESLATKGFAAWTKLMPDLDLRLKHGPAPKQ